MEGMSDITTDFVLELCALDKSMLPPACITEKPVWQSVNEALEGAFKYGGFVYLKVLGKSPCFVRELCMKALPGQYRLIALTTSANPKEEVQEWWEQKDSPFRGVIRFGDDDWDARVVCSDISVAQNLFKKFFDFGDLNEGLLQMRSQWDPKP